MLAIENEGEIKSFKSMVIESEGEINSFTSVVHTPAMENVVNSDSLMSVVHRLAMKSIGETNSLTSVANLPAIENTEEFLFKWNTRISISLAQPPISLLPSGTLFVIF